MKYNTSIAKFKGSKMKYNALILVFRLLRVGEND